MIFFVSRFLTFLLALAFCTTAFALVPNKTVDSKIKLPISIGQKILRPSLESNGYSKDNRLGNNILLKTDMHSGKTRLLSGGSFDVTPLDSSDYPAYIEAIKNFVSEQRNIFGITPKNLSLVDNALLFSKDTQLFKFNVLRGGLHIEDAVIDFRFRNGRLLQILNRSYSEAGSDNRPTLSNIDKIAETYFGNLIEQGQKLRVIKTSDGYKLVRVNVYLHKSQSLTIQIESATGDIFEVRSNILYADGVAKTEIYPRIWNEETAIVPAENLNLKNGEETIVTGENGLFEASEDALPRLEGFSGKYVNVIADTGETAVQDAIFSDSWLLKFETPGVQQPWEDQSIAQPMAYYHTQLVRNFARRFIETEWLEAPLQVNTNYDSNCNAFWNGISINLLNAGGECVHSGLIADVIYHEWGHGLDHNTGGIADVAFSEGFSDATSMLITKSPILAPNFFKDGGFVRDMEPNKVYPDDKGEVHYEGLIFGSTMWDIYKTFRSMYGDQVGTDKLANILFKTILAATHYTDAYETFLLLDDDDNDLTNGTPHYCIFNIEFANHGLAVAEDRCRLAQIEDFIIDDARGNNNGVIEPGETVDISIVVSNPSDQPLQNLKGKLSIPEIEGATLEISDIEWGEIAIGEHGRNIIPAKLSISPDAPCGLSFFLNIRLFENHKNLVIDRLVEVGNMIGEPIPYSVEGLPAAIPDTSVKDFVMWAGGDEWPEGTKVYDAHLKFDVTHPYIGDIEVHLITPDGFDKKLIRGLGANDDMHYDKDITQIFKGQTGKGIWTLNVRDWGNGDTGTLDSLRLTLTPATFRCEL